MRVVEQKRCEVEVEFIDKPVEAGDTVLTARGVVGRVVWVDGGIARVKTGHKPHDVDASRLRPCRVISYGDRIIHPGEAAEAKWNAFTYIFTAVLLAITFFAIYGNYH